MATTEDDVAMETLPPDILGNDLQTSLGQIEGGDVMDSQITVTMDDILEELGVLGRYQLTQIIITFFCVLPYAFALLSFAFIGYEPPSTCFVSNETELLEEHNLTDHDNPQVTYESCFTTVTFSRTRNENETKENTTAHLDCHDGYKYHEEKHVSMVSEWDLICDKRGVAEFVQTAVSLGMMLSSMTITSVADRFGRNPVYMVSTIASFVTELALVFSHNIYMAIALRFLSGLAHGVVYVIHHVICVELLNSKYRQMYGASNCIIFSLCVMLLAGVAFVVRHNDWRHLQMVIALSGVPVFLAGLMLNETPPWLVAQNKYEQVEKVVEKAGKTNGKDLHKLWITFGKYINQVEIFKSQRKKTSHENVYRYTLFDILRSRKYFFQVFVVCLAWFTHGFTYIGLFLISSSLAGNRFLNFCLLALLEIPSALFSIAFLQRFGRRSIVMIFMSLSGLCFLVATGFVASDSGSGRENYARTACFLIGKFTIGCSYAVLNGYTPELFPTTIRSIGTGVCASMASFGAMLAPFLNLLFRMERWGPGALLTALNFLCFLLFWAVPETRGRQLPTTIEEILAWK